MVYNAYAAAERGVRANKALSAAVRPAQFIFMEAFEFVRILGRRSHPRLCHPSVRRPRIDWLESHRDSARRQYLESRTARGWAKPQMEDSVRRLQNRVPIKIIVRRRREEGKQESPTP